MLSLRSLTEALGIARIHRSLLLGPPPMRARGVTDLQGTLLASTPVEALQHLAVHTQAQHLLGQLVVIGHCVLLGLPPPPEGGSAGGTRSAGCT